ncbi:MAG: 3-dehydroquinate synthase [Phycisphaerae bacterium]|nr:3-dehydroquinate synthase [Phycisphaerae bacterium]
MEQKIHVALGERSYDVRIAPGLIDQIGSSVAELTGAKQVVVITDSNVAPLYAARVTESLAAAGVVSRVLEFPAGEPSKNFATVSDLLDELLGSGEPIDRGTVIVPLGGGVAGDMGGFVAGVALRGLRFLQCPTSLLAVVDSSVGGKTGVDHAAGKNLIGVFHQPVGVLSDIESLRTLSIEELRNGLGECVKHAVIRDATLLDFIETNAETLQRVDGEKLAFDSDVMCELLAKNVAIKAQVVRTDERESGVRAHLNYGHTIGHAIETFVGYANIRHGEAVSLGMVTANHIAVARELFAPAVADRIANLLQSLNLPTTCGSLDAVKIWDIMKHDKKARGGQVRMVLPTGLGEVDIYDDITEQEVGEAVESIDG